MKAITIIKGNGERETFESKKLNASLLRAGASALIRSRIVTHIEGEISDGMRTSEIYRHAFMLLRKAARPVAARYSMPRAIFDLGPSGFPFETFVGEIFKARGFRVFTDQMLQGKCVSHEVDIVAQKQNECIVAELKFHNSLTLKSDVQVPLYVHSRFKDLFAGRGREKNPFCIDRGMLITNTKFTDQAIAYGSCAGLAMIGWNYPLKGNLHDLINDAKVHPLTSLTLLSKQQKRLLLERKVVLCQTLSEHRSDLADVGLSPQKIDRVLSEADSLCR